MRIVRVGSKGGGSLASLPFYYSASRGQVCIEDEEVSVEKCRSRFPACRA